MWSDEIVKEDYLNMVDEKLRGYVEQNIFSLYEKVDKGHSIVPVILESNL